MTIPTPQLDDRGFEEILDEALRLIPRYCPRWTNHNATDPGIALLEVFAAMMEGLIFRMNRMPEKATAEYLRLLGFRRRAGRPARAPVSFRLAAGSAPRVVPAGTLVATVEEADRPAVTFETQRDLLVGRASIARCLGRTAEGYRDLGRELERGDPVPIFGGLAERERFLHIGDPRCAALEGDGTVALDDGGVGAVARLRWEALTGAGWRELDASIGAAGAPAGEVRLRGPVPGLEPGEVRGAMSFWLRGRLEGDVPGTLPKLTLRSRTVSRPPPVLEHEPCDGVPSPLDATRPFLPLGPAPRPGDAVRIGCPPLLAPADARVSIDCRIDPDEGEGPPRPSPDLTLVWEWRDGDAWQEIATSGPDGAHGPGPHAFHDGTGAFRRSGRIVFLAPRPGPAPGTRTDGAPLLRARIVRGDYGGPRRAAAAHRPGLPAEARVPRPPRVRSLRISLSQVAFPPERCLSLHDGRWRDEAPALHRGDAIEPFRRADEASPGLYVGFDEAWPAAGSEIYFHLEEDSPAPDDPGAAGAPGRRVAWEASTAGGWAPLEVVDGTGGLTRGGTIRVVGPARPERREEAGDELFWLRARWLAGEPLRAPRLVGVHPDTTIAVEGRTFRDEGLGHGDGSPHREMRTATAPTYEEIALRVGDGDAAWTTAPTLAICGPDDRRFEYDPHDGRLRFGDGERGRVVPPGELRATYRAGRGADGNVGSGTLVVLRRGVAGIAHVTNPYPARGGLAPETPEEATARALRSLRSRGRAVTRDDYESLAREASPAVSLAWCRSVTDGEIAVVVLPSPPEGRRPGEPVRVPAALLDEVRAFLDERRLLSTRLRVSGPAYVDVHLFIEIDVPAEGPGRAGLRARLRERLAESMDPWVGGRDGRGWPPGRDLTRAEVEEIVRAQPGVGSIRGLELLTPGGWRSSDRLPMPPAALPLLSEIRLRVREAVS